MKSQTIEVKVLSNPKHRGLVDLKVTGQRDHKGAEVAPNGIRWVVNNAQA